jgi:hypothetical protein
VIIVVMPIGYLFSTGIIAAVVLSAVARHRPRRSSPLRLSLLFGYVINWPFLAFVVLVASTALAIAQDGVHSPVFWMGLALAVLASLGSQSSPGGRWGQALRSSVP